MRCSEARKRLNRYSDAELPPKVRKEIERHLATCADCRLVRTHLETVGRFWAMLDKPALPEGFANRVMQAARQQTAPRVQRIQPWWTFVQWWWHEQSLAMRAAAAAVVIVGSLAGWSFSGSFPPSGPFAGPDRRADADRMVMGDLGILSGAPDGSLEQIYLAWAFPAGSPGDSQ